jgi:hypothetical protein
VFLGIALACSIIFFITFTLISFRHKMGEKMSASLDKPLIQRLSAWLGFFGFMIGQCSQIRILLSAHVLQGITSFLILRMWFGKASDDFNDSIAVQGSGAPQLIANVGNAFTSTFCYHIPSPDTYAASFQWSGWRTHSTAYHSSSPSRNSTSRLLNEGLVFFLSWID